MRLIAALALPALLFGGKPSNAIYLSNGTGGTVNQPYILSRFFARGEILNYPKPTGPVQYQSEVKTRWPDGTVQHALIAVWESIANPSFPNYDSMTVAFENAPNPCHLGNAATCTAAGLDGTGMLTFNGGNWGAAMVAANGGLTAHITDAKTLISQYASNPTTYPYVTYWMRGPIVTMPIVEDRTSVRQYDFGWKCTAAYQYRVDPASDTFTAYDQATGTTPVNILAADGREVIFGTAGTGPTAVRTDSGAAANFAKGQYGYLLSSPSGPNFKVDLLSGTRRVPLDITSTGVGIQYISFCGGSNGMDYSEPEVTWADDFTYRPLHPMFILTFFPGWSGVYCEYIMQNGWTTAMQDQRYTITLKNGSSNSNVVRSINIPQFVRTEWVYRKWDGQKTVAEFPESPDLFPLGGTVPGPSFKINPNIQYLIYSRLFPMLEPSLTVDPDQPNNYPANNDLTWYASNPDPNNANPFWCSDPNGYTLSGSTYCGSMVFGLSGTGGRPELGLQPRWITRWGYTGDTRLMWVAMGNSDLAGTIPYHHWESATGKTYDANHSIDAFGHPISVYARPTVHINNGSGNTMDTSGSGTDPLPYIDAIPVNISQHGYSFSNGCHWVPEYSYGNQMHQPAYHFWTYMLGTGDPFYLIDGHGFVSQYTVSAPTDLRHNEWGLLDSTGERGWAWGWRSITMMALMTPDGWPEKDYFSHISTNIIPFFEAVAGLMPGQGYYAKPVNVDTFNWATEPDIFTWVKVSHVGVSGPDGINMNRWHWMAHATTALLTGGTSGEYDHTYAATTGATYQQGYLMSVLGYFGELGFQTDKIMQYAMTSHIEMSRAINSLHPRDLEQEGWPTSVVVPNNYLANAMSLTDTNIRLQSPMTWTLDPPFLVSITTPSDATRGAAEYIYVCRVSADKLTLTACSTGRAALRGHVDGGPARTHAIGDMVNPYTKMPLNHSVDSVKQQQSQTVRDWVVPFIRFAENNIGYTNYALVALSLGSNTFSSGRGAFDAWKQARAVKANYPITNWQYTGDSNSNNPKQMYVPRREPVLGISIDPGDTFAIIRYLAPSAGRSDAACTVNGVSDGQSNSRARWFVVTGLTASTTYTATINCAADWFNNGDGAGNTILSYRTGPAFSGTGTLSTRMGTGPTTAYMDYGSTTSLGTTVSAPCSSGCTMSASVAKGLWYYRNRGTNTATAPSAQPIIIR